MEQGGQGGEQDAEELKRSRRVADRDGWSLPPYRSPPETVEDYLAEFNLSAEATNLCGTLGAIIRACPEFQPEGTA
jgi:hypothetical protein